MAEAHNIIAKIQNNFQAVIDSTGTFGPDEPTPDDYAEFEAAFKNVTLSGHGEQQRRECYSFFKLNGEPLAKLSTPLGELRNSLRDLSRSHLKLLQDNLAGFFFDRPNFRRAYPDGYELTQAPDPCPPYGSRPGAFSYHVGPANIHHRISRVARALGAVLGEIQTAEALFAYTAKSLSDYGIVFEHHLGNVVENKGESGVVTEHTFRFRNVENPDEVVERHWRSSGQTFFESTQTAVIQFFQVTFLIFLPQNPTGPNSCRTRRTKSKTKLTAQAALLEGTNS